MMRYFTRLGSRHRSRILRADRNQTELESTIMRRLPRWRASLNLGASTGVRWVPGGDLHVSVQVLTTTVHWSPARTWRGSSACGAPIQSHSSAGAGPAERYTIPRQSPITPPSTIAGDCGHQLHAPPGSSRKCGSAANLGSRGLGLSSTTGRRTAQVRPQTRRTADRAYHTNRRPA